MRSMIRNGGVLLLFGMLVVVGPILSEPKPSTTPKSRIALVNLMQLVKGSTKVRSFMEVNKKYLQPLQDQAKKLVIQINGQTKELENKELSRDRRTELETQLTESKSKFDKLAEEAKAAFRKKNDEQLVIVYKEITETANRYARQHDFDMIFHYNDFPADTPDYFGLVNVTRKMQAGAAMPLYIRDGVEITDELIAILNDAFRAETKPDDKDEF
jgi:Skp family chaperone for outer membrane proteins